MSTDALCAGCRDGSGRCVAGTSNTACGKGGIACAACTGGQSCADGQCATPPACRPGTCDGCCAAGQCAAGTVDTACGTQGNACQACNSALGASCMGGRCIVPCGPATCSGCCKDGSCLGGDQTSACGRAGGACADCGARACTLGQCAACSMDVDCGAGRICKNNACVDAACAASCSGCCAGTACTDGQMVSACGAQGNACASCPPSHVCSNSTCSIDPGSLWDVEIVSGAIPQTDCGAGSWDSFGGLPDAYVDVQSTVVTQTHGVTQFISDTVQPAWNQVVLSHVPWMQIHDHLVFTVYDDDVGPDDLIGGCTATQDEAQDLAGVLLTVSCPRNCNASTVEVTIRYRLRPN